MQENNIKYANKFRCTGDVHVAGWYKNIIAYFFSSHHQLQNSYVHLGLQLNAIENSGISTFSH